MSFKLEMDRSAKKTGSNIVLAAKTGRRILQYVVFAQKALSWNADGAVVGEDTGGAHDPENRVPIYSPGVGAHGGSIESTIRAGARYLIGGRSITLAENPAETAKLVRDTPRQFLKE